jgi:hypothetical protein
MTLPNEGDYAPARSRVSDYGVDFFIIPTEGRCQPCGAARLAAVPVLREGHDIRVRPFVLSYSCRSDQKIQRLAEPGARLVAPDEMRQSALQMISHGIEVGPHPPSLRVNGKQAANQTARILAKTGRAFRPAARTSR